MRRLPLVHRLRNSLVSTFDLFNSAKRWVTYNFPHTVLDVVRSNIMGRCSRPDDNHFLPTIVLRAYELRCVDDLSLEAFLCLQRGCVFHDLVPE